MEFLWECSGAREFGFEELARDYVGREPTPVEAAGVLMKLHRAPMYFYRRGRGRYQPAPEATLKLALAAVEKKKRVQEQIVAWAEALGRSECPPEIAALQDELLYAPDRNKPETKALEQACAKAGLTPAKLFARCGRLADSHAYHLKRFLHEFFPGGAAFPAHEVPALPADLPLAPAARLQPGRHRHHGDRRRLFGAARSPLACASASTSRRPRSASRRARRSTPWRASACRPRTCRDASSPCCPRT